MATLDSSNIVNNNVIQTNDLLQLYNALSYPGASPQYLVEISGSLLGTASYATTASFALNGGGGGGGVTQIIAGDNITISPAIGTGSVIISSSGGGGSSFPFVGDAVITGSLDINGSNAGADLTITGSVVASEGFTGSLQGTSTDATHATTATTSLTASKVTITNDTSTNLYLPLIFASSSTAGTQQLSFDTDSGAPSYNPSLKSISASSFSGSLLGTATQAANSTLATTATTALSASTVTIANVIPYFLTFVDSNNATAASEKFFTNPSLTATSGLLYVPTLSSSIISASSITASAGFTGSLLGTATQAANSTLAATATSALSTSTVTITNVTPYFLTFVDTNNATAASEKFFTNPSLTATSGLLYVPTLSSSIILASSITASAGFTGSLLGISSDAVTSSFIRTTASAAATAQYLTFVDSNNTTNAPEQLSTDGSFFYQPSTNKFGFLGDPITGTVSASSFTGSLKGVASYSPIAITASVTTIPLTTTQWTSSSPSPSPFYVPDGRDVGVIWNNTGNTQATIFLNTSSAKLGDRVQIFSTVGNLPGPSYGKVQIYCSGSATPNTRVIVAGLTPNPSTHRNILQNSNNANPQDFFYFHLICVSGSSGATNNTTWQLVEYTAKGSTQQGSLQPWDQLLTTSV